MTIQSCRNKCWKLKLVNALAISGAIIVPGNNVVAQQSNIVPDNTLLRNERSRVVPLDTAGFPVDVVDQGAIRGVNLFHSFREFNVSEDRGAYFFSPNADIQNILTRVTGRNPSEILGTLGTSGNSQPNLFLMNPNGIVFGEKASLDVGGSFVATTANAILLGEAGRFSASEPARSNLLSVNPSALFFNAVAAQEIVNQSIATASVLGFSTSGLQVPNGRSLLLIGGDVKLEDGGRLNALGGRVELGGLAGAGTIGLYVDGNNLDLSFPDQVARADVSLINRTGVGVAAGGGGSIAITAKDINILDSGLYAGVLSNLGSPDSQAGDINLDATDSMTVQNSFINNWLYSGASGNAGDVTINTKQLSVRNGAQIGASTFGKGNGGDLTVRASDSVKLSGGDSGLFANIFGKGNAGNMAIETKSLSVTDGAQISASTYGQGNAGSVNISARDTVSLDDGNGNSYIQSNVGSDAMGNSGGVNITTGSLSVTDGAQIQSRTLGQGDTGKVKIKADNTVFFDGQDSGGFASGIFADVEEEAVGNSGGMDITARSLSITNGGQLSSSTYGEGDAGSVNIVADDQIALGGSNGSSYILNSVNSPEAVGSSKGINITTSSLFVQNASQIRSQTLGQGNAGDIKIVARDTISFDGRDRTDTFPSAAFTGVEPSGRGNGGNIYITTGSLSITNRAQLLSNTEGSGNAGNVFVKARDQVSLINSIIISEVTEETGVGEGGDINIKTGSLLLKDGSALLADLENRGSAGDIKIEARERVTLEGEGSSALNLSEIVPSQITATVERQAVGNGGDIDISAKLLSVTDDGFIRPSTLGQGEAGNLTITTENLSLSNNAFLSANTFGPGKAGNLTIAAERLNIRNEAEVSVSSTGTGTAGNLKISANSIQLDNRAALNSDTTAGQGNIILDSQDLVLRHGSDITTNATGKAIGGNITIDTNLLVALENSDVTANAEEASGGRIAIDAQGIVGTEFRNQLTPESDITATSELGPEFSGIVEINTPDTELQNSLTPLSAYFVSPEQVVAGSCLARRTVEQGSFTITGTGGLPRSPYEAISGRYSVTDVQPIQEGNPASKDVEVVEGTAWKKGDPIQEAQGMVVTADGRTIVGTTPQLVALAKPQSLVCDLD